MSMLPVKIYLQAQVWDDILVEHSTVLLSHPTTLLPWKPTIHPTSIDLYVIHIVIVMLIFGAVSLFKFNT